MRIQVEQQGYNECALATVAALSGKQLSDVRKRACSLAGVPAWHYATGPIFWGAIQRLADELGMGSLVEAWRQAGGMAPGAEQKIPKSGRGSVLIALPGRARHVMAYQGGLVYNSDGSGKGSTLEEILAEYKGWVVEAITPLVPDWRDRECPKCGVEAGRSCRTPNGSVMEEGHAARRRLSA